MDNPEGEPYYLQPIVVAPLDNDCTYSLIDGQQRMITLCLIYHALQQINNKYITAAENADETMKVVFKQLILDKAINITAGFRMVYETRKTSENFLNEIHLDKSKKEAGENPDYLYLWHAYQQIQEWLNKDNNRFRTIAQRLQHEVRIIWYELDTTQNGWKKFADLNVGKIPLTNSELIKALFMRSDLSNVCSENEKDIIANQWDEIERQLADTRFWSFLTNRREEDYPTRIDLLFDIISGKT